MNMNILSEFGIRKMEISVVVNCMEDSQLTKMVSVVRRCFNINFL